MGLIDLIPDLESPDVEKRFEAVTALYKLGAAAAPAVQKLVPLLRDIDGVNVKMTDGSERLISVAERASLALSAIGEPAAGAVVAELKADNAVSAIHCIRALATPLLAKRAPVAVIGERLMRPKVSLAMANALCEVMSQILISGDEASKTTARMALKAGVAAGKVPAKYQGLVTMAPAARPAAPAPAAPAAPAPAAQPAASSWMSVDARVSEVPAVRPAAPPPPKPAPPPPPPPAPEPVPDFSARPAAEPEVRRPVRPGSANIRASAIDRPTSVTPAAPPPEPDPEPVELRGRVIERPAPPKPEIPTGAPTATYSPEIVLQMQTRVPPYAPRPEPSAPVAYEAGDRFEYRQEIGELLKRGDKLKAVNMLRAKTGASLVEALRQIDAWS